MTDLAPSFLKVQQESLLYNEPTSEASLQSIGALANALREIILPVGSIVYSMLDESTFQGQLDQSTTRWVLCDGRNVTGSAYNTLTGNTSIPDLRGIFIRGKNNGRADGKQNPDGDLTLGTYTADKFASHNHPITDPGHNHTVREPGGSGSSESSGSQGLVGTVTGTSTTGITVNNTGGNETAVKNVTCNPFIRIN